MTTADHLQAQHGLDIQGEWRHAPDQYRRNVMNDAALRERHEEAHADDWASCYVWNEASERHSHPEFRYCEDCGKLLPESPDKGYPFCGAACEDRYLGVRDGED